MSNKFVNYKICLSGDTGVGKSSLVRRYMYNKFDNYNEATIGAAFFSREINYNKYILKLQIWDTAGQERYRSLGPLYYRGCGTIILVINGSDELSLERSRSWIEEIRNEISEVYIILAINKSDLENTILESKIKEVCEIYGNMDFLYVSAKSGDNIEKLFEMSFQKHQSLEEIKDEEGLSLSKKKNNNSNQWCLIL